MQEGFICAAGFDSSFKHVRPVIPNRRLSTSLLKENGGIFGLGAKVDLGSVIPRSEIPRIEDVVFDPNQARFLDTLDPANFWKNLDDLTLQSLQDIFGPEIEQPGPKSCAVKPGHGKASLGCLLPNQPTSLYIRERTNKLPQVRIILKDPQFDNELDFSVTDIRFFNLNDHVTINTNTVNAINKKLHNEQVILSVGLTYPYPPGKDAVHWVQVNGIHFKEAPLWKGIKFLLK
jgi:hypothetical protein